MENLQEIGIGIFAIGMPVFMVLFVFYFQFQESKTKHNALIEMSKNINDPSSLKELIEALDQKRRPIDHKRSGVVTFFVGIGLYALGYVALGSILEGIGLLLMAIGSGMVIAGYLFPGKDQ